VRKKEVDVVIHKTYYWKCPWCGEPNSRATSGTTRSFFHLKCPKCGAEINFVKSSKNNRAWIYEEE
jgi:translation initiation factor 2 beta subunit (eIF-2beta)/eIF-5